MPILKLMEFGLSARESCVGDEPNARATSDIEMMVVSMHVLHKASAFEVSHYDVILDCGKRISDLSLGHTMDLRGKLTVFKNLGCGAILGTRGKFYQRGRRKQRRVTHGDRSQMTMERSWSWRLFFVYACKLLP